MDVRHVLLSCRCLDSLRLLELMVLHEFIFLGQAA